MIAENVLALTAEVLVNAHILRRIYLVMKVHIPQRSWFNISRVTTSDL